MRPILVVSARCCAALSLPAGAARFWFLSLTCALLSQALDDGFFSFLGPSTGVR